MFEEQLISQLLSVYTIRTYIGAFLLGLFGSGTIILLGVYKEGKLPSKDKIVKLISQFILGGIGACIFILLGFPNNFNSFLMGCIALKFLSEIIEKINIHKLMNGEE